MVMPGPRTYTLVKVVSDAGVYGIGESYGSPGAGVKETHCFRVWAIGRQSWPHDDCQRTTASRVRFATEAIHPIPDRTLSATSGVMNHHRGRTLDAAQAPGAARGERGEDALDTGEGPGLATRESSRSRQDRRGATDLRERRIREPANDTQD